MRLVLFICMMLSMCFSVQSQQQKICTFNIKYENPGEGVHQWNNRKEQIINFIKVEAIDVIGMQEVLHSQINYLEQNLPNYHRVGVGRDDGKKKGEYSPIFFNKKRYELIDSQTFWLSPNPKQASKGWDAALPRICTWAMLHDKQTDASVLFLNTHFDHVGKLARKKSVDLILKMIDKMNHDGKTILMGDFNLEPHTPPIQNIINSGFTDSFQAPLKFGPSGSYNAFQIQNTFTRRIDYIFLKQASPKTYVTNSMVFNQTFLSDHFPVLVQIQ